MATYTEQKPDARPLPNTRKPQATEDKPKPRGDKQAAQQKEAK